MALTLADQSAGMVREAVERCSALRAWSVEGRQADAAHLPFADGSFDTVVAMHMMYHVADQAARHRRDGARAEAGRLARGDHQRCRQYARALCAHRGARQPAGRSGVVAFGFDTAERLMQAQFGNVTLAVHPARMRITDPEDVFLALTSYPPGDRASETELSALREAIAGAFARGDGVLEARQAMGLLLSRKER